MMLRQIGLGNALDSGRFTQEAVGWFLALLRDTPTMRNELAATPRVILPVRGMDERVLIPAALRAATRTPVLFVWGDEDPNGGPDIATTFAASFPDARLEIIERAGHAPWIDEPDRVAAMVSSFLAPERQAGVSAEP